MSNGILAQDLADALWGDGVAVGDYHARGIVTAVSDGKVSVKIRGSDAITCSKLDSYTPTVGDVALVLVMPSGCVALGSIG